MTGGNEGRVKDHLWATLVAGVLHPVQVEIMEALAWIDRPLSVEELAEIVGRPHHRPHIAHHLRRLRRIGAIRLAERWPLQGVVESRFQLALEQDEE